MKKTFIFPLLSIFLLVPAATINGADNEEVEKLKKEIGTIESNKEKIKEEINKIEDYIDNTEIEIMSIQNELNKTNSEIIKIEEEISELMDKISETQKDIEHKTIELDEQKVKLGFTLSFMYENQDFGFFQYFFQTENLNDIFKTFEFINIIADENESIYKEIQEEEKKLQSYKKTLESNQEKLNSSKSELVTLKAQQEQQKSEQDLILSQHKNREIEMLEKLENEEESLNLILQQINAATNNFTPNLGTEEIPLNPQELISSPMKEGSYYISSVYGYRTHPILGYERLHSGLDFAADSGTPIYSAGTGTVLFSGQHNGGYGNWVVIQHDNGYITLYAHLLDNSLLVSAGQRVIKGQMIAATGSTGLSSGPHLHFSVATNYDGNSFTFIDPLTVLK